MPFHLGDALSPDGDRIVNDRIDYDPDDLTTHGVIIGMTGSGKTGLGIIYLEEALRSGIPTLVLDPKGDMTNLLLTFPDLAPEDFRPWIDESAAQRKGRTSDEEARAAAELWRSGLASWDLAGADIAAMRDRAGMTIYTPGSDAGVPINVVGDLTAPDLSWDSEAEAMRDTIQGYVSGLLGLVDIDADPIASREHILLANLIEHAWRSGSDVDLATLIGQIMAPPMRKLGVFDIDTFFPAKARTAFAMRLNGLLASPAFAAWMIGEPLDIEELLWRDGTPQAAVIYLAHLSDAERQFIVTTIFSRLITWMRSQPGSSELRALAYMDEVFGFVPPTAEPPAKRPILTLLKQGRAFGIGMLLSTQNPVDLDYKAMSNAGTWCIGRLQTERDKARVLEAVTAATGDTDVGSIDDRISTLGKRTFLLHSTDDREPRVFTTRWAMSYLRGPMTRTEVASITSDLPEVADADDRGLAAKIDDVRNPQPAVGSAMPSIAPGIAVGMLDGAAPWATTVRHSPDGERYEPVITVTVTVHYDDARIGLEHTDTWEAVLPDVVERPVPEAFVEVDHDPRDITDAAQDLPFVAPGDLLSSSRYFTGLAKTVRDHLDRSLTLTVTRHKDLAVVSRPGEAPEAFTMRVRAAAEAEAEREMAALRDSFDRRIRKARRTYESARRDADAASLAADDARGDLLLGAGLDLLMGRKPRVSRTSERTTRQRLARAENKVADARDAYEDLGRELDEELKTIADRWADAVADVDTVDIGLEGDDIDVHDIQVVWVRR
jgi:hypothetical protein